MNYTFWVQDRLHLKKTSSLLMYSSVSTHLTVIAKTESSFRRSDYSTAVVNKVVSKFNNYQIVRPLQDVLVNKWRGTTKDQITELGANQSEIEDTL